MGVITTGAFQKALLGGKKTPKPIKNPKGYGK